jgi:trimethylamine--corrinoid protein Co-methyltransferase
VGPAGHFLGCRHTKANFRTAFYLSNTCDYSSFEQWQVDGSLSSEQRANQIWKNKLASYQPPAIDPAIDQALLEFIDQRKQVLSKN